MQELIVLPDQLADGEGAGYPTPRTPRPLRPVDPQAVDRGLADPLYLPTYRYPMPLLRSLL